MLIVNHGSKIAQSGNGWTNTLETATVIANDWLRSMRANNINDVHILAVHGPNDERWTFIFEHSVTGVRADLDVHGIDNMNAYLKENTFPPRTYWNENSSSTPKLTDFLCDGYEICIRKKETV